MAVTGITDAMHQYERSTDEIFKNKPKYGKAYGIKRPETTNIIAVLAVLFLIFVVFAEMMV